MDPTLLEYISTHLLPPTNEPNTSLLSLLQHLQLPLPTTGSLAADSVDFWDQRVVSGWKGWEETKWEKWTMDKEEVELVKDVGRRLSGRKKEEEERLDQEIWLLPPRSEEVLVARVNQQPPLTPRRDDDWRDLLLPLLSSNVASQPEEDDEAMNTMSEIPAVDIGLDLKLVLTGEAMQYLRGIIIRNKLVAGVGELSLEELEVGELEVENAKYVPIKETRSNSPPLFPRPPAPPPLRTTFKPNSTLFPPLYSNTPLTSPSGKRIGMKEWNEIEGIRDIPSSSPVPMRGDKRRWHDSSSLIEGLGEGSSPNTVLEEYEVEHMLFPRKQEESGIKEEEVDLNFSSTTLFDKQCSDSEEEVDQLEEDDMNYTIRLGGVKLSSDANPIAKISEILGTSPLQDLIASDPFLRSHLPIPDLPPSPSLLGQKQSIPTSLLDFTSPKSIYSFPSVQNPLSTKSLQIELNWQPFYLDPEAELWTTFACHDFESVGSVEEEEWGALVREGMELRKRVEEGGRDSETDAFGLEGLMTEVKVLMEEEVEEEVLRARVEPVIVEDGLSTPSSIRPYDVEVQRISTAYRTARSTNDDDEAFDATQGILLLPSTDETASTLPEFIDPPSSTLVDSDETDCQASPSAELEVEVEVGCDVATIELDDVDEKLSIPQGEIRWEEGTSRKRRVDSLTDGVDIGRPGIPWVELNRVDDLFRAGKDPSSHRQYQMINSKPNVPLPTASIPQTAWSSTQALSQFLFARGRKDLVAKARPLLIAPVGRPQVVDQVVHMTNTLTVSPSAPVVLPFSSPAFMSTALDTPQPFGFRIIASPTLLQMRQHYETFPSFDIEILDRPFRYEPITHVIQEPHLIISGTTCVLFHRLIKIVGSSVRPEELEGGRSLEKQVIDEAIFTSLSRLAGSYDRVLCILEEFPKGEESSGGASKRKEFVYTPPVLKALNSLSEAVKGLNKSSSDALIEVVITTDPIESVGVVRRLLIDLSETARDRSRNGSLFEDCGEERLWLTEDPREDELTLLQRPELNSVSACFILSRCDLASFIGLSKEERRRLFGGVCGEGRIDRLSDVLFANRQLHFSEKTDEAQGARVDQFSDYEQSAPTFSHSDFESTSFQGIEAAADQMSTDPAEESEFEFEGAFSQYVDYEGCGGGETVHLAGGQEKTFAYDYD